jgi:diguanylate cyclase (GGDEF)-like protein/PAS domain S-box-containing protein
MTDISTPPETDSAVYKTLLESTKAIPWKIDWSTMRFAYIGPQIERLLGWTQASWLTADDWAQRIHPDDREKTVNFCVSQSQAGIDHQADYRALTAQGEHIWIRDVVHVVRNKDGSVDSLIGFMFDIDEQKKAEEKIANLQNELEAMSYQDGLTHVANRRMFDMVMKKEWANAQITNQPLSLILIDIDYFKQYNDYYGHVQGDECLKQVATALNSSMKRTRDFFARYGGEEFIMILPDTDADAARAIAERCRVQIFKQQIRHEKSQVSQIVTISLGVGTITPSHQDEFIQFIEKTDARLYQAKQAGRNRVAA